MNPKDGQSPDKRANLSSLLARIKAQISAFFSAPVPEQRDEETKKALEKRHDECSRNLRNSVLAFGTFAIICWVALSKSDIDLLAAQSTVKIAVLQLEVTLDNFLAVVPMVMLLLLAHSSVFRLRLNALDHHVVEQRRFSAMFNLPGPMARLATFFLHVAVPLALIAFLIAKTSHREGFSINLALSALSLILVVEVHLISKWTGSRRRYGRIAYALATAILFAGSVFPPVTDRLRSASMFVAPLDFREVDFTKRPRLILSGRQFTFANFTRAHLIKANLTGANLSRANFAGADLREADLTGANLSGVYGGLANLSGANLSGANLSRANLSGASLFRADLDGAKLKGANLESADLSGADLSHAGLTGATLVGANFRKANLFFANLRGADLTRADLDGANLAGALLAEANFKGAKNLKQIQLETAGLTGPPINLPKGLIWPLEEKDGNWVPKKWK
ncbi:MAG: pentapeptide repeat-containing protein [Alphaproteobacteria bacterium]|nr:pentapeptide repeat-containing protein [Alphaproteobacteria bacterium]